MCRLVLLFLGLLLALAIAIVWAFHQWGPAALLAVFAAPLVAWALVKLFGSFIAGQLFSIPFRMKGGVLKGARVEVHSVSPADPPQMEAEKVDPAYGNWNWYQAELSVHPGPLPARGRTFTLWEVGELCLATANARSGSLDDIEDAPGLITDLWVHDGDQWQPDSGYKLPGSQRLRMCIGVPPGVTRLRFRYYTEVFGDLILPGSEIALQA